MKPQISIIIVNYNSGELLYNCLTSIKEKLSANYETVVVDNNSTDNSIALCGTFEGDSRFKFIRSTENLGFVYMRVCVSMCVQQPLRQREEPPSCLGMCHVENFLPSLWPRCP